MSPLKFIYQHIPTPFLPSGLQKDSIAFNLLSRGATVPSVSYNELH